MSDIKTAGKRKKNLNNTTVDKIVIFMFVTHLKTVKKKNKSLFLYLLKGNLVQRHY